jgi:hypothetical protein
LETPPLGLRLDKFDPDVPANPTTGVKAKVELRVFEDCRSAGQQRAKDIDGLPIIIAGTEQCVAGAAAVGAKITVDPS